jgi:hypothetical protein
VVENFRRKFSVVENFRRKFSGVGAVGGLLKHSGKEQQTRPAPISQLRLRAYRTRSRIHHLRTAGKGSQNPSRPVPGGPVPGGPVPGGLSTERFPSPHHATPPASLVYI